MPIGREYDEPIETCDNEVRYSIVKDLNLEFKIDMNTHKIIEAKGLDDLLKLLEEGYELTLVKPAKVKKVVIEVIANSSNI